MKPIISILFISLLAGATASYSQTYEYAQIYIVKVGIRSKANVGYDFGSGRLDSVEIYLSYKVKNFVDALELMDRKGWELISITEYSVGATAASNTTAYYRRERNTKGIQ